MIESSSNKVFGSDDSERSFRDYDGHEFTEDELSKNIDLCLGEVDKITWQSNEPPSSSDIVEPCIGMEFNSRDHAREFYIAYGRHTGFTVRIHHNRRSRVNNMVIGQDFVCSKEGFREKKYIYRKDRVLPPPPATREGCPAMLRLTLRDGVKWVVTKFIKEHNHTLMSPSRVPWRGSAKNFISEFDFQRLKKTAPSLSILSQETWRTFWYKVVQLSYFWTGWLAARLRDEKDRRIRELTIELNNEKQRCKRQCAAYQEQLRMVLAYIEEHTNHLSTKVQDIVNNVKKLENELQEDLDCKYV
ncbi:uncharacterized protein LOC110629521 isoform X1 [Manihot esculenta]|uniref:uncharacterized protein LOC110629521 isoform X1 n=1 Tax=Manihot esculenta TaxID=3983 RepID=UPI001CC79DDD|nr:uncharacterized protein LOC110629521 isoform X1 [Manihot esculenta]XP_043805688.1 uncharacterized protein LOC110629521 isoform X1 [Manihot esculenta]XP_043805689.1 uncharacterized protein LOC110629521 isoform X1 [Manihot esculenta]XP_043805690.1 uncharacterized protein LOC110629521 isoform X1 [Manihot esculenta]XP_043805691.1 uncharacterized protein LOC110629521 isoform X1 [Manihot esculenta]XP_043805692.1 uncharacterized protein LOC110629521 isoform X1 [Manihot esculenta]XP_043805693.1 un